MLGNGIDDHGDGISLEEAKRRSEIEAPALTGGYEDEEEFDEDLAGLKDPDVTDLPDAPFIGGRSSADLYGEEAEGVGRAIQPQLIADAAQFPTATQFRVWKWENGVAVGLGAIGINASEDEFIRKFGKAMPKPGEGMGQYLLRPITLRGKQLNKEVTLNIHEHHSTIRYMREQERQEAMERQGGFNRWGGEPIIMGGGDGSGAAYAEEMGRMFEQSVEAANQQTAVLQETLENERDRMRSDEKSRFEERIGLADRTAHTVEKMTERVMQTDRLRSEEQVNSQREQGQMLLQTLTTVFQQQQESQRSQAERQREADGQRMLQDREFFERQRQDSDLLRQRERDEAETKRQSDGAEWERKQVSERQRLESDRQRLEENRKFELEQLRIEAQRREQELERRRQEEREEADRRMKREKMELEERRRMQSEEWERHRISEKEERERRERLDESKWEREKLEWSQRTERERQDWERKESTRREEMQREESSRREETQRLESARSAESHRTDQKRTEEMQLQMKQMEMTAQRDREHSERMMEMSRLEREAQREGAIQRDKVAAESREAADRDRQRQHALQMREMELSKERDREHAERMLQLSKFENNGMGGLLGELGMDTPELLERVFGGGEGESGGWIDNIPKVLGAISEVARQAIKPPDTVGKPAISGPREPMAAIQTPDGPRLVPMSSLPPTMEGGQGVSPVQSDKFEHPLPPEAPESIVETELPDNHPLVLASKVNTIKRAKAAGINLLDQKKARRAFRKLVDDLPQSEEDEWMGLITVALAKTPVLAVYIKAVTVYAALAEAKVSPEFADLAVQTMRDSGFIPDDVPFDEIDFAKLLQAAEAGPEAVAEGPAPASAPDDAVPLPPGPAAGVEVKKPEDVTPNATAKPPEAPEKAFAKPEEAQPEAGVKAKKPVKAAKPFKVVKPAEAKAAPEPKVEAKPTPKVSEPETSDES